MPGTAVDTKGLVVSFIPCSTEDYPATAQLLLAMAAEAGHNIWAVNTVNGGFEVPEDIAAQLLGGTTEGTPPPGWDEPLPPSDVEFVDGKYMLTDEARARMVDEIKNPRAGVALPVTLVAPVEQDPAFLVALTEAMLAPAAAGREEIRTWAKSRGYQVADSGKLKQAVMEAFRAAHPDRATVE